MDNLTKEGILNKIKYYILPSESNNYKSLFLQNNILLYCVVLVVVLKVTTSLISINFPQNIFFADITKSSLEIFVNQTRQSLGIKPLSENEKLNQAAQLKAENMVQNQYFEHTSPTGVTPWFWFLKAGYNYKYAGENLAIGFFDSQEVFNAWLNSPSHKANITNPNYTEVGTAVLQGFGSNNSIIVVQEFGSQLLLKAPATPAKVNTTIKPNNTTPNITPKVTNNSGNEQVLSQTTESQNFPEIKIATGTSDLPAKVLNSVLYNYDGWIQGIVYGMSLVVIGILLTLIFFNFKIEFHKQLVFRAIIIIVLLSVATLTNREIMVALIPHQILI